ncbi:MAG: putative metal-binding motif-containing protein [Alphaproteobacteria bacterium]|nr:putative metal-binding motif-containing protein [Alphaproteobacteria bacterium]
MSLNRTIFLVAFASGCFVTQNEVERALDRDRDGFLPVQAGGDDCDEGQPDVNPAAPEICNDGIDNDCDGVPDDDGIGSRIFFRDEDGDGYGVAGGEERSACTRPEGFAELVGDCDDTDPAFNPAVEDLCDGLDQNCDGQPDDDSLLVERFYDGDGDGFGTVESAIFTCQDDAAYVALPGDCDDGDPTVSPAAIDLCDGIDQNCNGLVDENAVSYVQFRDDDGDGFGRDDDSDIYCDALPGFAPVGGDCADDDATVSPVAIDLCDGVDQNCNGLVDEDDVFRFLYFDADGDLAGTDDNVIESCAVVQGFVLVSGDCDDSDPTIGPLIPDVCDGVDQDCDGQVDDDALVTLYFADADGDGSGDPLASVQACAPPSGHVLDDNDCDDTDPGIRPGAADLCDGIDQDCDGAIDEGATFVTYYRDNDQDGFGNPDNTVTTCDAAPSGYIPDAGDCNDNNASVVVPTWYRDQDGDLVGGDESIQQCTRPTGYRATTGDCDDTDPARAPMFTEICRTGIDEDCDDATDCLMPSLQFVPFSGVPDPAIWSIFDTPVGTDAIFTIGNVVGDGSPDFLIVDVDAPWSQVVDGSTLNFLSSSARINGIACTEPHTANLTGSAHEELACFDFAVNGGLKVFRGGASFNTTPIASYTANYSNRFALVSDGPLGPGLWFDVASEVSFTPFASSIGQDAAATSTASVQVDGNPQSLPSCESSGCFVVEASGDGIYVFGGLTPGVHDASEHLAHFAQNPSDLALGVASTTLDVVGADGIPDLALIRFGTAFSIEMIPGPVGSSSTIQAYSHPTNAASAIGLPVGDMDGDGIVELVSNYGSGMVIVHSTDLRDPPWSTVLNGTPWLPDQLVFIDFDSDGFQDILMQASYNVDNPGSYPPLRVLHGNGI